MVVICNSFPYIGHVNYGVSCQLAPERSITTSPSVDGMITLAGDRQRFASRSPNTSAPAAGRRGWCCVSLGGLARITLATTTAGAAALGAAQLAAREWSLIACEMAGHHAGVVVGVVVVDGEVHGGGVKHRQSRRSIESTTDGQCCADQSAQGVCGA